MEASNALTKNQIEALRYIVAFSKRRLKDSDQDWRARQFVVAVEQLIQGGDREFIVGRLIALAEERSGLWELPVLASYALLVISSLNTVPSADLARQFGLIHARAQHQQFFDPRVFEPLRDGLVGFFPLPKVTVTAPDVVVTAVRPNPIGSLPLYLDPGDASPDDIRELLLALSDLHVAVGGTGLRFAIDGERILVSEGVAV